jgi:hypothetical protein
VSYNASAVKFLNTTSSLVRFENKSIFLHFVKTLLPTTTLALQLYINYEVVGRIGSRPNLTGRAKRCKSKSHWRNWSLTGKLETYKTGLIQFQLLTIIFLQIKKLMPCQDSKIMIIWFWGRFCRPVSRDGYQIVCEKIAQSIAQPVFVKINAQYVHIYRGKIVSKFVLLL